MNGCLVVTAMCLCGPCQPPAGESVKRQPEVLPPGVRVIPIAPLPTGQAGGPRYGVVTEVGVAGVTQRFRWRDEDETEPWEELATGRDCGQLVRKEVATTDYSRSFAVGGDRGGMLTEIFLANSWAAELEITSGRHGGKRVALRLHYYPREGHQYGIGFDSRNGVIGSYGRFFDDDDLAEMQVARELWRLLCLTAMREVAIVACPLLDGVLPAVRFYLP